MKEEKHGSNISHLMVSDKSVYIVLRETGPGAYLEKLLLMVM